MEQVHPYCSDWQEVPLEVPLGVPLAVLEPPMDQHKAGQQEELHQLALVQEHQMDSRQQGARHKHQVLQV